MKVFCVDCMFGTPARNSQLTTSPRASTMAAPIMVIDTIPKGRTSQTIEVLPLTIALAINTGHFYCLRQFDFTSKLWLLPNTTLSRDWVWPKLCMHTDGIPY